MARVVMEGIHKSYGPVHVVKGIDLEIEHGEFVALLGPSGCGKTTTLRMIAGLEEPTKGRLWIGDEVVSEPEKGLFVPPERRHLGMVFQSYAVWPHMSVADNVAYPLKLAKVSKSQRKTAVQEALDMVQLGHLGARMPNQLSGGQQQRVALARALVMKPRVLLLDEPLSNLDAHLREELRREISLIREKLGVTVIYVTHDQEEALALADRIVVMNGGFIRQAGPPAKVYKLPEDSFVGGFIGKANFLRVVVMAKHAGRLDLRLADGQVLSLHASSVEIGEEVLEGQEGGLMIRPEAVGFVGEEEGASAVVKSVTYLGDRLELLLGIGDDRLRMYVPAEHDAKAGERVRFGSRFAHLFGA